MCDEAPGLVVEKRRLTAIGGAFLGIIGDPRHTFGYHLCNPPASDYSRQGAANRPVGNYSCAIDIGMGWKASRAWLRWLIGEIDADRFTGIAEVIGSYDGRNVRYWSDSTGWHTDGVLFDGDGHDTWTHVAIYRSTALADHGILAGWTATGRQVGSATPSTGSGTGALMADASEIIVKWAEGNRTTSDGKPVEPVNWRIRDEKWQGDVTRALAENAARDKATQAAVQGLVDVIKAGGGDVDIVPLLARINEVAAAESRAVAELQGQNVELQDQVADLRTRLAEAAQDAADKLAGN